MMTRHIAAFALSFATVSALGGAWTLAADHDHKKCMGLLTGETKPGDIRISGSGQDADLQPELREAARVIYHEIAPKLGLNIPPTTIRFVTATDMAALSSNAGHPAPHWHDGANVAAGARQAAGILEFVVPGQPVHHQFVRDTNSKHDSLIVLAHVAGHYDFAENSTHFKARSPDQIRYSHELAQMMTRLYTEVGHADVSEFYQRLLSLSYMQDMSRGSFTEPEAFDPKIADRRPVVEPRKEGLIETEPTVFYPRPDHPSRPTESMLQAFVRNLPATAEPWKRQMADVFEKLHRAAPAYVQSKIMNEGWATLMEYMVLAHSPWNSSADAVAFGQLNQGVNRPSLSNPYWLGSQAWFRIRARFMEQPEIKDLPPLEQDRLFIAEAHKIMAQSNDYNFLRMALDSHWVEKQNLLLYRVESKNEWEGTQTNLGVTRDAERVVNWIAHKVANHDLHFPKIDLDSFNSGEKGTILLRHKPMFGIPLKRDTVAKALYVIARIMERPVTMDTIGTTMWEMQAIRRDDFGMGGQWTIDPNGNWIWMPTPKPKIESYPMKITVRPDGKVTVEGARDEATRAGLEESFGKDVEAIRQDSSLTYSADRAKADLDRFNLALLEGNPGLVSNVASLMTHAPTAAQAVIEYMNTVAARLDRTLRLAVQGKWPIKILPGAKKVRLRVLPEIPMFELDLSLMEIREKNLDPTQPDPRFRAPEGLSSMADLLMGRSGASAKKEKDTTDEKLPDEDLEVGEGPYLPGDRWKSKSPPKGKGKGKGEGEGEGEEPGDGAGDGSNGDPAYVDIPIDKYADMLFEELQLRNLRRTEGDSEITEDVRIGGERRPEGYILWDRTAQEALGLGMAMARKLGKDPTKMTKRALISLGLKYLPPADHIVASRDTNPQPDIDAVVTFIADTSGSMGPEHQKVERQMVFNTLMILRRQYPNVKTRFVIYDTTAREVTEEEFFSRHMGGGTDAQSGLKLAQQILSEYAASRYNRYAMLFSDGDDFSQGLSIREGEKVAEMTEYFGYGHIEPRGDYRAPLQYPNLSTEFRDLSLRMPNKVGFAKLSQDNASILDGLRAYFGKQPPGQQ